MHCNDLLDIFKYKPSVRGHRMELRVPPVCFLNVPINKMSKPPKIKS